ncbi:hypothetical protein LZ31DRAFT_557180 [Colletotrichum somersetense]|nr:hypothetical protein LZ31DRAFT_557180 [Colletotrichum somersetense]
MKTFVTALVLFGTVAFATEITVSCAGISSDNTNPCDTVNGTYSVSSGFCCIDSTKENAYETECVQTLGLSYSKIADNCLPGV